MKLYESKGFPNPRRVRVFLAEKGVDVEGIPVNVMRAEHRQEPFVSKNPFSAVPTLELDDGRYISESSAICRYFEETHPEPALMGSSPEEKGEIDMWNKRIEQGLMEAVAAYFHHATEGLGELELHQIKDWGERSRDIFVETLRKIEKALTGRDYIAGRFSVADITALVALDFGKACNISIPDDCPNVQAWYQRLSARASAAA